MTAWVKGGTTSATHDTQVAKAHAEAEARRAQEDAKFRAANQYPAQSAGRTGVASRVSQTKLIGEARIVLGLKHPKDGRVQDWMTCELSHQGRPDDIDHELMLNMCCPRCSRKFNRHPEDTQMKIHQRNRMFHLDTRTKDQRTPNSILGFCAGDTWVNPEDVNEVFVIAGMITTDDWIKCPGLGCDWQFKIDDSVVYTR